MKRVTEQVSMTMNDTMTPPMERILTWGDSMADLEDVIGRRFMIDIMDYDVIAILQDMDRACCIDLIYHSNGEIDRIGEGQRDCVITEEFMKSIISRQSANDY